MTWMTQNYVIIKWHSIKNIFEKFCTYFLCRLIISMKGGNCHSRNLLWTYKAFIIVLSYMHIQDLNIIISSKYLIWTRLHNNRGWWFHVWYHCTMVSTLTDGIFWAVYQKLLNMSGTNVGVISSYGTDHWRNIMGTVSSLLYLCPSVSTRGDGRGAYRDTSFQRENSGSC